MISVSLARRQPELLEFLFLQSVKLGTREVGKRAKKLLSYSRPCNCVCPTYPLPPVFSLGDLTESVLQRLAFKQSFHLMYAILCAPLDAIGKKTI